MISICGGFEGGEGFGSRCGVNGALVDVLEAPTKGFEGLEVGSKPRIAGVCSFFGDQWGVNVEEVRKSGIVARQEVIKRRGGLRTSWELRISLRKA